MKPFRGKVFFFILAYFFAAFQLCVFVSARLAFYPFPCLGYTVRVALRLFCLPVGYAISSKTFTAARFL